MSPALTIYDNNAAVFALPTALSINHWSAGLVKVAVAIGKDAVEICQLEKIKLSCMCWPLGDNLLYFAFR